MYLCNHEKKDKSNFSLQELKPFKFQYHLITFREVDFKSRIKDT